MAETKWADLYKKCKDQGLCCSCRKAKVYPGITKCRTCWFKLSARRNIGDASRWPELEALLLSQQSRCAYSGRELVIGKNASVEHVTPISKSKSRAVDIANIKWIDSQVNMAKGTLSLHEFILLCKEMLTFFGYEIRKEDAR